MKSSIRSFVMFLSFLVFLGCTQQIDPQMVKAQQKLLDAKQQLLHKALVVEHLRRAEQEQVYEHYVLNCRIEDTAAGLPVIPTSVDLPALVTISFGCSEGWKGFRYQEPQVIGLPDDATVIMLSTQSEVGMKATPRDWALLARMLGLATLYWERNLDLSDYGKRAFFTSGFWQPRHMSDDDSFDVVEDNLVLTAPWVRLKSVVENEKDMKKVGEVLLPLTRKILIWGSDEQVKRWLPYFMDASVHDFPTLQFEVWRDDQVHDKNWIDDNGSYLLRNERKLEGWFMRRWIQAGRGQAGYNRLLVYRFWMTRLAQELDMPQAKEWARHVRAEITSSPTFGDKTWYLARL